MKISWKPPKHNGGSRINAYVIEASPSDDYNFSEKGRTLETNFKYTLEELEEGERYDIRVRAVNEMGLGEPSVPCFSVVPKDARGKLYIYK